MLSQWQIGGEKFSVNASTSVCVSVYLRAICKKVQPLILRVLGVRCFQGQETRWVCVCACACVRECVYVNVSVYVRVCVCVCVDTDYVRGTQIPAARLSGQLNFVLWRPVIVGPQNVTLLVPRRSPGLGDGLEVQGVVIQLLTKTRDVSLFKASSSTPGLTQPSIQLVQGTKTAGA
jgi:hypothetical protein